MSEIEEAKAGCETNVRSGGAKTESDTVPREPGCQCQWEAGDSPCPVHGDCEETDRGELGDRGELDATDPPRCERAADLPPVQDATSGRHEWINLRGIVSCRKCGVCRPHDWATRDLRCRGVVRIELRAAVAELLRWGRR